MKKTTKIVLWVLVLLLIAAGGAAYAAVWVSEHNLTARDGESHLIYIYPNTPKDSLLAIVEQEYEVRSPWTLKQVEHFLQLRANAVQKVGNSAEEEAYLKTGCYRLQAQMSDRALVRMLHGGRQEPVKLTFYGVRTPQQMGRVMDKQLMLDSAEVTSRLTDAAYMAQFGLTLPQAMCLFIPNTYEVWWNMSADDLFRRMEREYKSFWNTERLSRCGQMGMTPTEVVTLASIVEEETRKDVDKPLVAGLYINRLRRGMLLQADPTVKFAVGDFGLRRILKEHLRIDSPYNTYRYAGLPPGPIRTPSPKTVDYTLHYTPSNYLYMCASPALDGTHRFSSNYNEHMRNAREYQRELNRRGIKR